MNIRDIINIVEKALDVRTPSVEELAVKYNLSNKEMEKLVYDGSKIELEHTTDIDTAREIALDHLGEKPDYYKLLKKHVES